VAAVLVPLMGVGVLLFLLLSKSTETEQLYAKYAVTEDGLPTLMNENSKKHFDASMVAFKDESYAEAKNGFENLSKDKPTQMLNH